MYQPWQTDPSMEAVIKLIEERERNEANEFPAHNINRVSRNTASNNWGIKSIKDLNAPKRPPDENLSSSHQQGRHGQSVRPEREESPRRLSSREVVPAAKWGIEIARSLTTQLRLNRRSSSSDDDRNTLRPKRRQDSPEKRISTQEWKRRRSRSNSRSKKRGRSDSRDRKRDRSRSREYNRINLRKTRSRSSSRDKRRNRGGSRDRKRLRSSSRDKNRGRNSSRDRQRNRSGSRDKKRNRSSSRDKRDRSSSTDRNAKNDPRNNSTRDSEKKSVASSNTTLAVDTSKTIQPTLAQTPAPATVTDTTNDILSKFVDLIKDAKEQSQSQKIPNNDVLPEFDPVDKANSIVTWLTRVDDVAKLFGWDEKETMQYALPKLAGDARIWYLGRKDFVHSWAEWKKKLYEQYPCPDFVLMLEVLMKKRSDTYETLEHYFCDKIVLVKRCGIRGRQAVECVLQGIHDEPVRLFAAAAQFDEPEELLRYLRTAENIRSKTTTAVPPLPAIQKVTTVDSKPLCTVCQKYGHVADTCHVAKRAAKKLKKSAIPCTVCYKYGHTADKCWHAVKVPATAASINIPKKSKIKCFSCGEFGHKGTYCPKPNQKPPPKQKKCFVCKEEGHTKINCPYNSEPQFVQNNDSVTPSVANGTSYVAGGTDEPPPPGEEY